MSDLKSTIAAALHAEPALSRSAVRLREASWLAAGGAGAVALFFACGGFRDAGAPRPPLLIALTLSGTVAVAGIALRAALPASALPRSKEALLAALVVVPGLFFGWKVGWSVAFDACAWWPTRPGLRCLGLSGTIGLLVLAACVQARRGRDPVHPRLTGAGLGVASGAVAAVLADLWCPVGHPVHVLLGHVLPMLALSALGARWGGRVLGIPSRRDARA